MASNLRSGAQLNWASRRAHLAAWRAWLNGPGHARALIVFLAVVTAHMLEHVAQAIQVFVLGWPRPQALGLLGLVWPWLVQSEWLHFSDVLLTLGGLLVLRYGFRGEARRWWTAAIVVSVWHLFEHTLLLGQALTGTTLWGAAQPTSVVQLVVPRVELHLFYNGICWPQSSWPWRIGSGAVAAVHVNRLRHAQPGRRSGGR
jgi:hypothetical protein